MKATRQLEMHADFDSYFRNDNDIKIGWLDDVIESDEEDGYPSFKIVIPGISEWQNRYQKATDFDECKTDPSHKA